MASKFSLAEVNYYITEWLTFLKDAVFSGKIKPLSIFSKTTDECMSSYTFRIFKKILCKEGCLHINTVHKHTLDRQKVADI